MSFVVPDTNILLKDSGTLKTLIDRCYQVLVPVTIIVRIGQIEKQKGFGV